VASAVSEPSSIAIVPALAINQDKTSSGRMLCSVCGARRLRFAHQIDVDVIDLGLHRGEPDRGVRGPGERAD
jgi:hypothetical protein